MKEIAWPGGKNKPPKGKPEKRHFKIVTLKEDPYVMYRELDKTTGLCGHHSVPCRLVYNPVEQYVPFLVEFHFIIITQLY